MAEILAPVAYALMDAGQNLVGLASCPRSLRRFGLFATGLGERGFVAAEEPRVPDKRTVGQCSELIEPNVYPDSFICYRKRLRLAFASYTDKPLSRLSTDCRSLRGARQVAVETPLDLADLGHTQVAIAETYSASAPFFETEAVVLAFAFESRISWLLTGPEPAKERAVGKINPKCRILQQMRVDFLEFWVNILPLGEMLLLSVLADAPTSGLIQKRSLV